MGRWWSADGAIWVAPPIRTTYTSGDGFSVHVTGPQAADQKTGAVEVCSTQDVNGGAVPGVTYTWTQIDGPTWNTSSIDNNSLASFGTATATTTIGFHMTGIYKFRCSATAGGVTRAIDQTIQVTLTNSPPTVNAGVDQTTSNTHFAISGTVSDDGYPLPHSLTGQWSLVSGPGGATIATPSQTTTSPGVTVFTTIDMTTPGTYTFRLSGFDSQLTGYADTHVTLNPPSGALPLVTLTAPAEGALVTKPVPITGSVTAGSWAVQYRLGGRDDVDTPWRDLLTGTGAKTGSMGTFDPTLLENGTYTIRLRSVTTGGEAIADTTVSVDGQMKVGLFSLSYVDMEVNLGKLPIQILRNYDNRRGGKVGDYGADWELATRAVRVEKAGKLGKYWAHTRDDSGFFPVFCIVPQKSSRVTITLPGGKQYRFRPSQECQEFNVVTSPEINWVCESHPGNPTVTLTASDQGGLLAFGPAPGPTTLQTANGDPWDPRLFQLTIEDGTVLDIDQDKGLTQVTDRRGNFYQVTPGGIISSTGASVPFVRDNQGRISKITDPAGQALSYVYNAAGDLFTVTDRTGATTTYTYDGKHNITKIVDSRGIAAARIDYDASGRMIASTDALGNVTHLTHDVPGQSEVITDRLGKQTTFQYDDRGNVVTTTDARGGITASTYDTYDNELTKTDAIGRTTTFTYDLAFNQTSVKNAKGELTTRTYDQYQHVLSTTDPLGHITSSQIGQFGEVGSTTDALGHVTSHEYDNHGNHIGMIDPNGKRTIYVYDDQHRLTKEISPLGHVVQHAYDTLGREIGRFEAKAQAQFGQNQAPIVRFTGVFDTPTSMSIGTLGSTDDGLPPSATYTTTWETVSGPPGAVVTNNGFFYATFPGPGTYVLKMCTSDGQMTGCVTGTAIVPAVVGQGIASDPTAPPTAGPDTLASTTVYDANGRVLKSIGTDGAVSETTYDAVGNVLTRKDPLGRVSTMTYDDSNRVLLTTYPDGTVRGQTYDAEGRAITRTDESGHTTTTSYDAVGSAVKTTFADGTSSTTAYDLARQMVSSTDERGNTTTYGYDAAGRRTSVTNALSQTSTTTYDAAGRAVAQTDALGHTTTTVYDDAGRVTQSLLADGQPTTYVYDAKGQKLSETDALSRISEWAYDVDGKLVESRDQSNAAWTFAYDGRGNLVQQTDALGRVTRWEYDEQGRQTKRTLPLGMSETFAYDVSGRKTAKTDFNGFTTSYSYDERGRLIGKTPDPKKQEAPVTYAYTPTGRKAQATNGSGTVSYLYDGRDRLAKKTMPAGALSYTYDPHGNVATMKSSNVGGVDVQYGWDAANRLSSVTDPAGASTFEYDAAGRMTKRTDPNGVVMTYAYDNVNRVLDVAANRGTTPIADYAYQRDLIGRVTTLTELSGRVVTYGYSVPGRLVNETITGEPHGINGSIGYTHDAVGNRLTRTSTVGPVLGQTFAYDANDRIVSEGYDLNGNTLQAEGDSFAYDFEDRLVGINGSVGLAYDGEGNMLSRSEAGVTTKYLVDDRNPTGWSQVVEEVAGASVAKTYSYGESPLRSGNRSYVTDGHTDVRLMADVGGSVTDEYDYEAFGVGTRTVGSTFNPLRYTGERSDSGGLGFLRARHLRNGTGRFLQVDSLAGDPDLVFEGLPSYLYGSANPVNRVDPGGTIDYNLSSLMTAVMNVGLTVRTSIVTYRGYITVVMTAARVAQAAGKSPSVNKLIHIFEKASHKLEPMVEYYGSQAIAYAEVEVAASTANLGRADGVFQILVRVGPFIVRVNGKIIDGVTNIGTFRIP